MMISLADSAGWAQCRCVHGAPRPGSQPFAAFRDGEGNLWEIENVSRRAPTETRAFIRHLQEQERAGRRHVHLLWDGSFYRLSRYLYDLHATSMQLWDGLELAPDVAWAMSGPFPEQGTLPALWTPPNEGTPTWVTLYIRWRSWGVQPERCLWTGNVLRFDSRGRHFGEGLGCPCSPNLLPTLVPADLPVAESRGMESGFLSILFGPAAPEVGLTEKQEAEAQRLIFCKADAWLRQHGMDPAAWTGP